jgi:multiple sugar transport system substrate-binding protein
MRIIPRRRRTTALVAAAAGLTLLVSACSSSAADAPASAPASSAPAKLSGTVTFWHFFTDREAAGIQKAVDKFEALNPGVKVEVKSGQDDEKTIKAIAAGQPIDVVLSYSTDQIGKFCSTGAWQDLSAYIQRDGVDINQIPPVVRDYTQFDGKRCSMPALSDTYGLYYNKKLLAAAGYSAPPKTMSELTEMAKKLTVVDGKGAIQTAGFVPSFGFYENAPAHFAPSFGATWFNADGKSNIGTDPGWASMMKWQKGLVDFYGYDKLTRFTAGLGQEFSADNAFEKGKVAMMIDGEYRNAFIKAEAPTLDYGTAPFPTDDAKPDLYGAGYVTGNVIGIGRGAQNPEAAWALIKYLSTDTDSVVAVANGIKNVPTTTPALTSPALEKDANYQTFLDVFANAHSSTTPTTASGKAYQDTLGTFAEKWQSGKVPDLAAGLTTVDQQINDQLALGSAP